MKRALSALERGRRQSASSRVVSLWVAGALALTAGPAAAQCWSRAYTAEHLAAHPGQSVSRMALTLGRPGLDGLSTGALRATLRGASPGPARAPLLCRGDASEGWICGIVCDGGRFQVTPPGPDGSVLLLNGARGLLLAACDGGPHIPPDDEHAAFRLNAC